MAEAACGGTIDPNGRSIGRQILARLQRVTSGGRFVPEIDGLRFVAIMSVLLYHVLGVISVRVLGQWSPTVLADNSWMLRVVAHGYFGVPLFFVISGFILAKPFAEAHLHRTKPVQLRRYYLRRLTRLEPPYYINLLVLFLIALVRGLADRGSFGNLLASMCYVHNLVYNSQSKINSVAWSLEVEVQFYILAPFLTGIFRVRSTAVRRSLLVVGILLAGAASATFIPAGVEGTRWQLSILNYLQYFLAGFLLIDLYLASSPQASGTQRSFRWDALGLVAWATTVVVVSYDLIGWGVLVPLLVCVAYLSAFRGRASNWLFTSPLLYTIGGMCYTIYLWHQCFNFAWGKRALGLTWIGGAPMWLNALVQFALVVPLILAGCAVLFVCFERPFMRPEWPRAFLQFLRRARAETRSESGEPKGG